MDKIYKVVSLDRFKTFKQLDDKEKEALGKKSTDIEIYYLIPIRTMRPMNEAELKQYRKRKMQERINE